MDSPCGEWRPADLVPDADATARYLAEMRAAR